MAKARIFKFLHWFAMWSFSFGNMWNWKSRSVTDYQTISTPRMWSG